MDTSISNVPDFKRAGASNLSLNAQRTGLDVGLFDIGIDRRWSSRSLEEKRRLRDGGLINGIWRTVHSSMSE